MVYPQKYKINFEKIKPYLINAFTSVYGEHNREIITDRINRTFINDYMTLEDLESYFSEEKTNIQKDLLIKLINILFPDKQITNSENIFGLFQKYPDIMYKVKLLIPIELATTKFPVENDVYSVDEFRIVELFDKDRYNNLLKSDKDKIDQRRIEVLNGLGVHVTVDEYYKSLNDNKLEQYLEQISDSIDLIKYLDSIYSNFLSSHKDVIEFLEDTSRTMNSNEINIENSTFQQSKLFIDKLELITDDGFDMEFIKNRITCCTPGITIANGKPEPIFVIHFPRLDSKDNGKRDLTFIHEIQHAIETELIDMNENYANFKTGFELNVIEEFKGKPLIEREGKRKTELMSETIHQAIAKEVTNYLHSNGIYIFNNGLLDNDPNIKHTCIYDDYYEIVCPLLFKYKQEILDARLYQVNFEYFVSIFSEDDLSKINLLIESASKLSGLLGINKETNEYKNLVESSKNIVNNESKLKK